LSGQNVVNIPPQFIPTGPANLLNCGITSLAGPVGFSATQPYLIVYHIALMNTDTIPHVVTLYKGASGGSTAGTQYAGANGITIAAGATYHYYGQGDRFDSTTFLTGADSTATNKVVITVDAEIYME
jgi:hypothetical protein